MPPSHLNLARRKALAARIAVSINLEASPLPVFDDKDESQGTRILKMAFSNADYAAEMLDERLDKALKKVADNLGYIFQHNNASSADAFHGKIDSLLTHLRAYDCEKCAGGINRVCGGQDTNVDNSTVSNGGHCLGEIKYLVDFVDARVKELHNSYVSDFVAPKVEFSTGGVQRESNSALLSHFSITGWTEVRDNSDKISLVGLEIKDDSFDWRALCQTLYVLSHEFVCHAYQGLEANSRKNADEKCSWSEGWMDRLAFQLVIDWLSNKRSDLPEFLKYKHIVIQDYCEEFHNKRYDKIGTLKPHQQKKRISARQTFDELKNAWCVGMPLSKQRVTEFSVKLNVLDIPMEQRETLSTLLVGTLQNMGSSRYERAVQFCSEFLEHKQSDILIKKLEGLLTTNCSRT